MPIGNDYSPYDPTGTTWNVVHFDNEILGGECDARWQFQPYHKMTDRGMWNGYWTYVPGSSDRITTYTTPAGKNETSIDEIIFLNKDRFIVMHDNLIVRLGRRI
jgi:hypothetical protein